MAVPNELDEGIDFSDIEEKCVLNGYHLDGYSNMFLQVQGPPRRRFRPHTSHRWCSRH